MNIELELLAIDLSIAKLSDAISLLPGYERAKFISYTKTEDEISLVADSEFVPEHQFVSNGWKGIKLIGPLDFSLVGVLQKVIEPLAIGGISVFTISTYETDYVLVRQEQLEKALELLGEKFTIHKK